MDVGAVGVVEIYVHNWERTGLPPVQPDGKDETTVLDWVLFG